MTMKFIAYLSLTLGLFTSCANEKVRNGLKDIEELNRDSIQWKIGDHSLSTRFLDLYQSKGFKEAIDQPLKDELKREFRLPQKFSTFLIEEIRLKDGFKSLIVGINSYNGDFVVLISIKGENEIIFSKHLTVDHCDIVDQDDEKEVIWCDKREASFLEGRLYTTKIHIEEQDYGEYSLFEKDSVNSIYSLSEKGMIYLIMKDSIRLSYKKN